MASSLTAVAIPAATQPSGVALLHESFTALQVAGFALALTALAAGQLHSPRLRPQLTRKDAA